MMICKYFLRCLLILVTLLVKLSQNLSYNGVLTSGVLEEWGLNATSIYMDLSNRGIIMIEDQTFIEFKNLEILQLSDNLLEEINSETFSGLTNLVGLHFANFYPYFIDCTYS